jgi:uncharacterized protein YbjT (DUF2867 family)
MKRIKNVVVFGAGGKVGSLVVQYALADGYHVIAFVHRHHSLPSDPNLQIVTGDIYNRADIEKAMKDADAVISCLSSWGTQYKDVLATAMSNIVAVAKRYGISRIISVTGADARAPGDDLSALHRLTYVALHIVASKIISDGDLHIKILHNSRLKWTVIRSPVMTPRNSTDYVLNSHRPTPWAMVSRRGVARAMVDQIDSTHNLQRALYIH